MKKLEEMPAVAEIPKTAELPRAAKTEKPKANNLEKTDSSGAGDFDIKLEALNGYFQECKKNGIEVTDKMARKEIKDVLGLSVNELLNQDITDPKIKKTHKNIAERVEEMANQEATEKNTTLNFLREKVFGSTLAKAAFVTAMLFLKFNPAHAGEQKKSEQAKDKMEHVSEKKAATDGGDKKTFPTNAENFKEAGKNIKIEANSYFDTDKADIKDPGTLGNEFDKFLSSINNKNFSKIIDENWVIKGSSDERKTSNWEGKNQNLTEARISAFLNMLESAKQNHDFSKQGLSAENIQQVLDKKINSVYPTNGPEKGVTTLTDLINEKGEKYTLNEIKNLQTKNPAEYQKLLDKCRYTTFEVQSSIIELDGYDKCVLLIDNSPSTEYFRTIIASELEHVSPDKQITEATFSSGLDTPKNLKNSYEAAMGIKYMSTDGSNSEHAISAAIQYLDKYQNQKNSDGKMAKQVMYLATDEGLRGGNLIKILTEKAAQSNTDVKILMFREGNKKPVGVSLSEINSQIEKIVSGEIKAKQEQAAKNLIVQEKNTDHLFESLWNKMNNNEDGGALQKALAKDGIKMGDKETVKAQLLNQSYVLLKNIGADRIGAEFTRTLGYLQNAKLEVNELSTTNIDKQLVKHGNINLDTFPDEHGQPVSFPITE